MEEITGNRVIEYELTSLDQTSRILGDGAFGTVRYGRLRLNQTETKDVAVKRQINENTSGLSAVKAEIKVIGNLSHPNIIKLLGIVRPSEAELPWLIMEYMEHGSLLYFMRYYPDSCDLNFKMTVAKSVAAGMKYLNVDMGIVHGDLHGSNCLIADFGRIVKIGDFGCSFKIMNERKTLEGPIGKLGRPRGDAILSLGARWKPPEWIPGERYHGVVIRPGDVWAYAILLFELWTKVLVPYHRFEVDLTCHLVALGFNPLQFNSCDAPPEILNIMRHCFAFIPAKRPTFKGILEVLEGAHSVT